MKNLVLLDTNVISFIFKQDSRAGPYERLLQGRQLAVSMMTVAELSTEAEIFWYNNGICWNPNL